MQGYRDFLCENLGEAPASRKSSRQATSNSPQEAVPSPRSGESYRLLSAASGEEAIALVKQELAEGRRVAAGFFDVKLEGGIDGLTTIQEIKKLDPDLRCVVVTAYHDRSVDEINTLFGEAFKDHWDYLNKPFTRGEIVQKARQMVSAWNREKEVHFLHEQLIRSERLAAIGQVARGVGHEFGNILLRIMGKADLALSETDMSKVKGHLEVVISASERASVIVRNLQSFSKTEPVFEAGSVNTVIEEALSLVGHEYQRQTILVERLLPALPDVKMDRVRIGQVVLNLLINAMHAVVAKNPKGGKVSISSRSLEAGGIAGVEVSVADSGTGIPSEVLPRIFDFAFTTKGEGGSGLGLAVSKEIINAHSGQIAVNTQLGQGADFRFWIPLGGPAR